MKDSNQNLSANSSQFQGILDNYFHFPSKYSGITESNRRIEQLILSGNLNVQTSAPLPLKPVKSSTPIKSIKKSSFRVKTHHQTPHTQTPPFHLISNKNKRFVQCLLQKYQNLYTSLEKLPAREETSKMQLIFKKICEYQQILQNASHRFPSSPQQEKFLQQSFFNIRLSHSIDRDLEQLKEQARRFNCSIHRKNKYYECLSDIRKKLNSIDQSSQLEKDVDTLVRAVRKNVPKEKIAIDEGKLKGREYLSYSKSRGVESKSIYERERGNVRFVREVVHHWWSDNQRVSTLQSSLS